MHVLQSVPSTRGGEHPGALSSLSQRVEQLITTLLHTNRRFRVASKPKPLIFELWRKPECPEENPHMHEKSILYIERQ